MSKKIINSVLKYMFLSSIMLVSVNSYGLNRGKITHIKRPTRQLNLERSSTQSPISGKSVKTEIVISNPQEVSRNIRASGTQSVSSSVLSDRGNAYSNASTTLMTTSEWIASKLSSTASKSSEMLKTSALQQRSPVMREGVSRNVRASTSTQSISSSVLSDRGNAYSNASTTLMTTSEWIASKLGRATLTSSKDNSFVQTEKAPGTVLDKRIVNRVLAYVCNKIDNLSKNLEKIEAAVEKKRKEEEEAAEKKRKEEEETAEEKKKEEEETAEKKTEISSFSEKEADSDLMISSDNSESSEGAERELDYRKGKKTKIRKRRKKNNDITAVREAKNNRITGKSLTFDNDYKKLLEKNTSSSIDAALKDPNPYKILSLLDD